MFLMASIPMPIKKQLILLYSLFKIKKDKSSELENNNINHNINEDNLVRKEYIEQIISISEKDKSNFVELSENSYSKKLNDPKIIAYYLPQFYPFKENDEWWGKGTTEWNNVCKAVPQFVGHYQPRLPGELGFYDLRVVENMERQAELAVKYGISAFCFYFYWFDGKRLLDKPLDMFLNNKNISLEFCLCWANENWTRRFDGTNAEVLMQVGETVDSYSEFIKSIGPYISDSRYMKVDNKPAILIYRPSKIPMPNKVLAFWRDYCKKQYSTDIYIIGVDEMFVDIDFMSIGYDAMTEFQPGSVINYIKNKNLEFSQIRKDFAGHVYDYKEIVDSKLYEKNTKYKKAYKAVMPMWDNTARRNNKGIIFHGSTPELYKRWLKEIINYTINNKDLEDKLVFINAWNEWGEGAYLEPDRKFGYAYLNATREALESSQETI